MLLSRQQEGLTIVSEPDKLGVGEVSFTDWDLSGYSSLVRFVAVRTAGEEEVVVDLVCILLEPLLQDPVCFIALLSFEHMGDFSAMYGQDESIGDSANCLIEVGLSRKDVDHRLRQYWDVVGCEGRDIGGVGDWVEWNREVRRGQHSGGGRLIQEVNQQHSIMEKGEGWVDCVVEISVGVIECQDDVRDGE
jgi:hypothetical protein